MRVRCIKKYEDLKLNKIINVNDEFEVTAARGKELAGFNNKAGEPLVVEVAGSKKAVAHE